jgi:hypothetical protein
MKKPIFALADPDIQQAIFFDVLDAKNQIYHSKYPRLVAEKKDCTVFFREFKALFVFFKEVDKSLDAIHLFHSMFFQVPEQALIHWRINVFEPFLSRQCF